MTACAVMLVKDEVDVIQPVVRHLLANVDHVIVADNGSTDGTRELLQEIQMGLVSAGEMRAEADEPRGLWLVDDDEVGHYQSRKTTALAMRALEAGHKWVVPCDADEIWYAPDGRRIAEFFGGLSPDVQVVVAPLFDHLPTALDPPIPDPGPLNEAAAFGAPAEVIAEGIAREQDEEPNPFKRIGWRNREHAPLPKVACRLRPDLVIEDGNHGARTSATSLTSSGLVVRHFTWRSEEQYVRKIRNGARAFAATDLPESTGAHWRMHGDPEAEGFEERVREHFRSWFWSPDPGADEALIYDPVTPLLRGS